MSSPTLTQFIAENEQQLHQLHQHVLELNEQISFEDFCAFAYQHSY